MTDIPADAEVIDLISDDEDQEMLSERSSSPVDQAAAFLSSGTLSHGNIHRTAAAASARFAHEASEPYPELFLFTDGSVKRMGGQEFGAAGIACTNNGFWAGRCITLGEFDSSDGANAAETAAILVAIMVARRALLTEKRRITIVTDSSMSLSYLAGHGTPGAFAQPLVENILRRKKAFEEEGVRVTFRWVKGHAGTRGNELADRMASLAAASAIDGKFKMWDIADLFERFPEARDVAHWTDDLTRPTLSKQEARSMKKAARAAKRKGLDRLAPVSKEDRRARKMQRRKRMPAREDGAQGLMMQQPLSIEVIDLTGDDEDEEETDVQPEGEEIGDEKVDEAWETDEEVAEAELEPASEPIMTSASIVAQLEDLLEGR